MKKTFLIFAVLAALSLAFVACEKNDKEPKYDASATVLPEITNPANGAEFTFAVADSNNAFVIDWSEAEYSINEGAVLPVPVYSLLIVQADSSWDNAIELINTTAYSYSVIVNDFNNSLNLLGLEPEVATPLKLKVSSIISNVSTTAVESSVIEITATTYAPPTPPPSETARLYVPGDYQGWDPGSAPNIWSIDNDGVYTGFVFYPEGGTFEFKFTSAPSWDGTNFGAGAAAGTLDTDSGAGNLSVPGAGGYVLECDTVALTWSATPQSWGVIGSGILNGDWSEDVDMEYDIDNLVLTVTLDVTESQDTGDLRFKFRANDGWDLNYGLTDPVNENDLAPGGTDIPMPEGAGNYTITLDLGTVIPTYTLTKN